MIPESKAYYLDRRWEIFFGLLAPIEQRILYAIATASSIGAGNISIATIADDCLKTPDEILPLLQDLVSAEILVKHQSLSIFPPVYFFNSYPFEQYCLGLPPERVFDPAKIAADLTAEFHQLASRRIRRITEIGLGFSLDVLDEKTKSFFLAHSKTS